MGAIFGYGEDSLTLWALRNHLSKLLNKYRDQTDPGYPLYKRLSHFIEKSTSVPTFSSPKISLITDNKVI
jgi:hypothetical protein